jgi:tetratricopeptide (TPR) repeat protein
MARVPLPEDVEARELDYGVRKELMTLAKDTAEIVAKHLVMAGRLMDEEPEAALAHARAARALAGRVAAVREANGLVAYTAGEWAEALSELRTARRLSGDPEHLPVMADCERALGRPDRALLVCEDPQAGGLSPAARVELLIVASGARRDQGHAEAAVVSLQVAGLEGPVRAWTARLRYAYADALLEAGREEEARQWFARTADVDEQQETDAEDRLMELDGVVFDDLLDGAEADEQPGADNVEISIDLTSLQVSGGEAPRTSEPSPAACAPEQPETERVAQSVLERAGAPAPIEEPTRESLTAAGAALSRVPMVPISHVQDAEIPSLGKAGSTGLGFMAPPEATLSGPPAPSTGDDEEDDLRLFD